MTLEVIPNTRQTQMYSVLLSKFIRSAPSFISNYGISPDPQLMSSTIDTVLTQLVVCVGSENYDENYL